MGGLSIPSGMRGAFQSLPLNRNAPKLSFCLGRGRVFWLGFLGLGLGMTCQATTEILRRSSVRGYILKVNQLGNVLSFSQNYLAIQPARTLSVRAGQSGSKICENFVTLPQLLFLYLSTSIALKKCLNSLSFTFN
jgi:hypothetical protein